MTQNTASASALLRRWQRLHLLIRCALQHDDPALVRQYLACGTLLTRRAALAPIPTQRRMLELLLQTAADPALPWFWRSVCLEHTTQPLARLSALLRPHDPLAFAALEDAVAAVTGALPVNASAARSG